MQKAMELKLMGKEGEIKDKMTEKCEKTDLTQQQRSNAKCIKFGDGASQILSNQIKRARL